jgi:hypothetical protein
MKPPHGTAGNHSNWRVFHVDLAEAGAQCLTVTRSLSPADSSRVTMAPCSSATAVTIARFSPLPERG